MRAPRKNSILLRLALMAAVVSFAQILAQTPAPRAAHRAGAQAGDFDSLSARAKRALDADKLDEAIPLLRKALAINPQWAEGWWSLGTTLYDENRFAEASLAFQKVVTLDPKHGTAHALLGLSEFEMDEDDAALKNIEESKSLGTDLDAQLRDVIMYHEGVLLQRKGLFVAAQKPLASLCLGGNRNPDVLRAFGMAALHMNGRRPPAAGTEASGAVDIVGRGACLAAYKDFDASKEVFTQAIAQYSKFPFVHFAYGRELIDAREIPAAVEQFKIEASQSREPVLSLLQIAAAEYKVDSQAGLPYAQQAVKLVPKMPFAHFLNGLLLMDTGEYEKAVPELEFAKKGMPNEPKVLWSLSSAYGHVGRLQDAAKVRAEFARLSAKQNQDTGSENPEVQVNAREGATQQPNN